MSIPRALLIVSWAVFVLVWLALAFTNKRTLARESVSARLGYAIPMFAGICLIARWPRALHLLQTLRLPTMLHPAGSPLHWLGALAAIAGTALAIWARLTLGRNWSGTVTLKQDHELVTRGPYGRVRHPIYSALLLLFIGTILFVPWWGALLGLGFILASFWIKLRAEEALMTGQFPEDYPAYRARTRRLIPFIL